MLKTKLSKILTINICAVLIILILLALYNLVLAFFGCNLLDTSYVRHYIGCSEKGSFVSSIVLFILILFVNFTSIRNSKNKYEYFVNSSPQIILLILLYLSLRGWNY